MEPKFKVGDVVNLIDNQFFFSLCIEVTQISYIDFMLSGFYEFIKLILIDIQFFWEYYLIEGTRIYNDLPDWRGELYNFYIIYGHLRISIYSLINQPIL